MTTETTNLSYASSRIVPLKDVLLTDELAKGLNDDIVFIHVPKTGGTNIDYLLSAVSVAKEVDGVINKRFSVMRTPGISPNFFKEGSLGGFPSSETIKETQKQVVGQHKKHRFFSGHMPTGLRQEGLQKAKYISLVREPVSRALSSINFDYQRSYVFVEKAEEYAKKMLDNLQTRLIAGKEHMSGPCTEDTYFAAIKNIETEFLFVAPSESVDAVMAVMGQAYGVGRVAYSRLQVTGNKLYNDVESAPERLVSMLLGRNKFDARLYNYVVEKWQGFYDQHVSEYQRDNTEDEEYFTLPPDILEFKKAKYMKIYDIDKFNKSKTHLVEVFTQR